MLATTPLVSALAATRSAIAHRPPLMTAIPRLTDWRQRGGGTEEKGDVQEGRNEFMAEAYNPPRA